MLKLFLVMGKLVHKLNTYIHTFTGSFVAGCFLGVLIFIFIYGWSALDPHNTAWTMNGQDLEQHYFGWEFFKSSPWTFPIGEITALAYPYGIPIVFTDSIPLVAIPLKLFSGVLPYDFQYFGIWGALSFGLTAAFAAVIIRRFNRASIVGLLGAVLVVCTPVLLSRVFIHTALASVWIILASFALIAYRKSIHDRGVTREITLWSLLFISATLIHPYYLPMIGAALFAYVVIGFRSYLNAALKLFIPPILAIFVFWATGGLSLGGGESIGMPNEYNLDLAAVFSGSGWSQVVPSLSSVHGESMMFVGLGSAMLICLSVVLAFCRRDVARLWAAIRTRPIRSLLLLFTVLALLVLSLGTVIRFNGVTLLSLEWIPMKVQVLWATFRSCARLAWPLYYFAIVGSFCYLAYAFRNRRSLLLCTIVILAGVQFVDVLYSPAGHSVSQITRRTTPARSADEVAVMKYIKNVTSNSPDKKHIVYLDSMEPSEYFDFDDAASVSGLTINKGYFSRSPQKQIDTYSSDYRKRLENGEKLDADNIYVLDYPETIEYARNNTHYSLVEVGKYVFLKDSLQDSLN